MKAPAIACAMIVLGLATSASAGPIADAAGEMQPGEWREITTNGFGSTLLDDFGGHHIFQYSEDALWDSAAGRVWFIGQGHSSNYDDDPSTPARFIRYDDFADAWELLPVIPSENIGHSYDHSAYVVETNTFYHRPFNSRTVYAFADNTWTTLPDAGTDVLEAIQCCGALEYFPEMNSLVLVDGDWGVVAFDLDAQQWTRLGGPEMGPYSNFAEYSAPVGAMILGGGNGSPALHRLDADGTLTALPDAPVAELGVQHSVTTVDPNTGVFLVFHKDGSFYEYNLEAQTWLLQDDPAPFVAFGEDGAFGTVAASIDSYGVILTMTWTGDGGRTFLYRHSPGEGTPPMPGDDESSGGGESSGSSDNGSDDNGDGTGSSTSTASGPGDGEASDAGASSDPGGGSSSGGAAEGDAVGSEGCGCRTRGPSSHAWLLGLLLCGMLGPWRRWTHRRPSGSCRGRGTRSIAIGCSGSSPPAAWRRCSQRSAPRSEASSACSRSR